MMKFKQEDGTLDKILQVMMEAENEVDWSSDDFGGLFALYFIDFDKEFFTIDEVIEVFNEVVKYANSNY